MQTDGIFRAARVELSELDEQSACYNHETGETHLLNAFPAEILRILGRRPRSIPELAVEMARLCDEASSAQWESDVGRVLLHLESLELVERRAA